MGFLAYYCCCSPVLYKVTQEAVPAQLIRSPCMTSAPATMLGVVKRCLSLQACTSQGLIRVNQWHFTIGMTCKCGRCRALSCFGTGM